MPPLDAVVSNRLPRESKERTRLSDEGVTLASWEELIVADWRGTKGLPIGPKDRVELKRAGGKMLQELREGRLGHAVVREREQVQLELCEYDCREVENFYRATGRFEHFHNLGVLGHSTGQIQRGRQREGGPAPVRRRGSRRTSSTRAGPSDSSDGPGEPEPRTGLRFWHHPEFGWVTPNLYALLEAVGR